MEPASRTASRRSRPTTRGRRAAAAGREPALRRLRARAGRAGGARRRPRLHAHDHPRPARGREPARVRRRLSRVRRARRERRQGVPGLRTRADRSGLSALSRARHCPRSRSRHCWRSRAAASERRPGSCRRRRSSSATTQLEVEVAATPATRSRGLMFRESLPDGRGMLFVFPKEQPLQFWMRNTTLPLSIAFADDSGRIVHIADLEPLSEALVPSGASRPLRAGGEPRLVRAPRRAARRSLLSLPRLPASEAARARRASRARSAHEGVPHVRVPITSARSTRATSSW